MQKSTLYFSLAATAATLFPAVNAHGYLASFAVDGHYYPAFSYDNQDTSGPVRITDYLTPWYDVNGREIACGRGARKSSGIAEVHPDSSIAWGWRTDADKTWVHFEGTSRTFIASCNGDCSQADETTLEWWEIASKGRNSDGTWPVSELNAGNAWIDKFPGNIPDGDYLLRNELTAWHYSTESVYHQGDGHSWGMEYYPTCVAVRARGGSGSIPSQVMHFPGAYNVDQEGHYNPDLWQSSFQFKWAATNTFARTGGDNSTPAPSNPAPSTPAPQPQNPSEGDNGNNNNTPAPTTPDVPDVPKSDPDTSSPPATLPTGCKPGSRKVRRASKKRAMESAAKLGKRGHLEAVARRRLSSGAH